MSDLVIGLVHAWLLQHPEHISTYVNPYSQLRWHPTEKRMLAVRVGGHWRRLDGWGSVFAALRCVCKFVHELVQARYLGTPMRAVKQRWDENGDVIPRKYRVTIFL